MQSVFLQPASYSLKTTCGGETGGQTPMTCSTPHAINFVLRILQYQLSYITQFPFFNSGILVPSKL